MQSESVIQRGSAVWAGGTVTLLIAGLLAGGAHGDQVGRAELTDFRAPLENYPPPNATQAKTLLEGAKAEPQPGGWFLLTGVKLKTFSTNGTLELLAESPQCFFDSVQRTVSSAGPLQVRKVDGTFYLEGVGFLLQPTNSNLTISNRVHTVIRNLPGKSSIP
jgi:hypothetical protein